MRQSIPLVVHESDCKVEAWDDPRRGSVTWKTLLSSDRTPTDSLTVGLAELPGGTDEALALRRHDHSEVYYVLSGKGRVVIEEEEFLVRPGEYDLRPRRGAARRLQYQRRSAPHSLCIRSGFLRRDRV